MDTRTTTSIALEKVMAHAGWARALARRLVGDPDAAEDLLQDTLVASWKHPPALDRALRPWLATVLRNLARSRHRDSTRAERRELESEGHRPPVPTAEESLAALQAQRRLAEAVAQLAEPYRQTVILRHLEGMSAADIARAQGLPEGTVRWRLKAGLDWLRDELAGGDADWRRALAPLLTGGAGALPRPPAKAPAGGPGVWVASGPALVVLLALSGAVVLARRPPEPAAVSLVPRDPRFAAGAVAPDGVGAIAGRVLGPDGAPPVGAFVTVARVAASERGASDRAAAGAGPDGGPRDQGLRARDGEARSNREPRAIDREGRFRLEDLAPGTYTVTASAAALLSGTATVTVPAAGTARVDLRLASGGAVLRGQVLDGAAGVIGGARIELEPDGDGPHPVVASDQGGRYEVRAAIGPYWVHVSADGYARQASRLELVADQAQDYFLQPAAALAGQVVDGTSGDPVADAFVRAEAIDGGRTRDGRSRAGGAFQIDGLEPGHYRVFARKGTRVGFAARPIVLAIGARAEAVAVPLSASFSIRGRVLDPAGEPVAGAQVGIEEARGAGYGFVYKEAKATTGAGGRYRIDAVVAGVYHLGARAPAFGDAEDVTVGVDGGDQLAPDLRLAPAASVHGRVVSAGGRPVAGVEVDVKVRSGDEGNASVRAEARPRTDPDGRFPATEVSAGWVTVTASRGGRSGETATQSFALAPGQNKDVELTFAAPAFIEGRVRWVTGGPAAGVHVVWEGHSTRAVTDAEGRYHLGPVSAQPATVHAERPGANSWRSGGTTADPSERWLKPQPGETLTGVDLVLEPGDRQISGVVLGPDGSPLPGAVVQSEPDNGTAARSWTRTKVVSGPDGAFTIAGLTRGRHIVSAREPRFPESRISVEGGTRGVRLRVAAEARLAGTLIDPAGGPVAVATVRVVLDERRDRDSWTFGEEEGVIRAVQDRGGQFSVGPLAAGTYDLLVTTPSGGAGRLPALVLAEGQVRGGLRVVVGPSMTLQGRIVAFGSEQPIGQASIGVAGTEAYVETRTDDQGVFQLDRQIPGRRLFIQIAGSADHGGGMWTLTLPPAGSRLTLPTVRLVKHSSTLQSVPGMTLTSELGPMKVVEVAPGSPYALAGVTPDDVLSTIDGHDASGLGEHGVSLAVTAGVGPAAELLFVGPGGQRKRVLLPRAAR